MEPEETKEQSLELDQDALNRPIDLYVDINTQREEQEVQQQQIQQEDQQAVAEQDDPRNAEQWGTAAVAKKLFQKAEQERIKKEDPLQYKKYKRGDYTQE